MNSSSRECLLIICVGNRVLSLLLRSSRSHRKHTDTHTFTHRILFPCDEDHGRGFAAGGLGVERRMTYVSFSIKPKPFVKTLHHMGPSTACLALFCTVLQLMPPALCGPLALLPPPLTSPVLFLSSTLTSSHLRLANPPLNCEIQFLVPKASQEL